MENFHGKFPRKISAQSCGRPTQKKSGAYGAKTLFEREGWQRNLRKKSQNKFHEIFGEILPVIDFAPPKLLMLGRGKMLMLGRGSEWQTHLNRDNKKRSTKTRGFRERKDILSGKILFFYIKNVPH